MMAIDLLRGLSPAFIGVLLGGWTSWTILPAVSGLIGRIVRRPYWGLGAAVVLEMIALRQRGLTAFLALLGLWMVWLPRPAYHLTAAMLLALAGILLEAPARWVMWVSAVAVLVTGGIEAWMKRGLL